MNRREIVIGAAAAVLAGTETRAQTPEIVVGALYPMSGPSAQIGADARVAFDTALDIINNDHDLDLPTARGAGLAGLGGAKVRVVLVDHQGDPQRGRAEAERLIAQDKVAAIVGAFHSSVSAAVSLAAERFGIPYVAADSSSPSLHRRNLKFFFCPAAHDEMFSAAMFDFLDVLKAKGRKIGTVALFHEDTIFGTDSATIQLKLARERGYEVAADVKYKASSPSLTDEVRQLKAADADVLLPSSYTADAILLVQTMGELGYRPRNIIAQAAGFSQQPLFDAVGDRLGGLISRASFSIDLAAKRPSVAKVNDLFKARAGKDLNDNTSRQLTALLVLADAIDRARSTEGGKIRDAMASTDIPGERTIMPWKRVKFGPDGQNVDADPVLIQYVGGRWLTVFPERAAASDPHWPMNA